ncbi:MAG: M48 family metallopeptidase [Isosphaeraceae bacterium]
MDFFQHQESARRKTGLLVFYFIVAVVLIVLLVYAILEGALALSGSRDASRLHTGFPLWDPGLFGGVALLTLTLIGGGSAYRIASLASGGHNVAEMMGGRPLQHQTADPDERKILNVVEEMAIASGTPVPPVYLLEQEDGINAFAAGFTPRDAVIGVTRGCIRNLTRDELQGVIAHEFSHIFNGDMRLNIRLIGVLYGILLISITGWIIFRSTAGSYQYEQRRDGEKRGVNPWPLVGLALYVLGYVGVLFGNLIKAAVSRQREFLADASAVQFTRNPDGIAGALKKIGALAEGSRVRAPEAQEASHLFFGDAMGRFLGVLATHPPLVERIRRIDPSFDGDFSKVHVTTPEPVAPEAESRRSLTPQARPGRGVFAFNAAQVVDRIGTVEPEQLAYASAILTSLPDLLKSLAYDPFGARAIVFALLLDHENETMRRSLLDRLGQHAEPALCSEVEKVLPIVHRLTPELRLPLVSMAAPALSRLSRAQFESFVRAVRDLALADNHVSLYEYALQRLLLRHVATRYGYALSPAVRYRSPEPLVGPVRHVLGALAHVGSAQPADAASAFALGIQALGWPGTDASLPPRDLDLKSLDLALNELDAASPPLKRRILGACAACIGADGRVTLEEGELLRAIADSLGCPVPPLQSLSGAFVPSEDPTI